MKALLSAQGNGIYVDEQDLAFASQYLWTEMPAPNTDKRYLARFYSDPKTGRHMRVTLARAIMGAPRGSYVRYRDGDPNNCRRANLCVITAKTKEKEDMKDLVYVKGHSRNGRWFKPLYRTRPTRGSRRKTSLAEVALTVEAAAKEVGESPATSRELREALKRARWSEGARLGWRRRRERERRLQLPQQTPPLEESLPVTKRQVLAETLGDFVLDLPYTMVRKPRQEKGLFARILDTLRG